MDNDGEGSSSGLDAESGSAKQFGSGAGWSQPHR